MKKILLMLVVLSFNSIAATTTGYDAVKRWKVQEDQLKTQEMMFPMGHDFVFGPKIYLNTDIFTVLSDAKGISGGNTAAATALLQKFDKSENMAKVGLDFAIPLPSFTIADVNLRPNLRVNAGGGFLAAIESKNFTTADAEKFLGTNFQFLVNVMATCNWGAQLAGNGNDLIKAMKAASCSTTSMNPAQLVLYNAGNGVIILPIGNDYAMNTYVNLEGRAGLYFDYDYGENIFGTFNIYGLYRRDFTAAFSAGSIGAGQAAPDPSKVDNATMYLNMDFSVGYKMDELSVRAGIEDVKLTQIQDPKQGVLGYEAESLLRVHAQYEMDMGFAKVVPFVGLHKRSSYDLSDGAYGGAEARLMLLDEALMFRVRGTLDPTYFTLAPMFKFWVLNIDTLFKVPLKSDVDGVKPPTTVGLNLRFAI